MSTKQEDRLANLEQAVHGIAGTQKSHGDLLRLLVEGQQEIIKLLTRRCCINRRGGRTDPIPVFVQAMRTEFGRPSSSMRLRTWTATPTSIAWRSSVCERRPSPITCLKRDIPVSALARLV